MSRASDGDERGDGGVWVDQGVDLTVLISRFSVLERWAHRSLKNGSV
jgi:hypothetical protein